MSGPAAGGGGSGNFFGNLFGGDKEDIKQTVPGYTIVPLPGRTTLMPGVTGNIFTGATGATGLNPLTGRTHYQYNANTPQGVAEREAARQQANQYKTNLFLGGNAPVGGPPGWSPITQGYDINNPPPGANAVPATPSTLGASAVGPSDRPTRPGQIDAYNLAQRSGVAWHTGDRISDVRLNIRQKQIDAETAAQSGTAAQPGQSTTTAGPPPGLTAAKRDVWNQARKDGMLSIYEYGMTGAQYNRKIQDLQLQNKLPGSTNAPGTRPVWDQPGMNAAQKELAKDAFESQGDPNATTMPVWWNSRLSKVQEDMLKRGAAMMGGGYPSTFTDMPKLPAGESSIPGEPSWMYANMPSSDFNAAALAWQLAKDRLDRSNAKAAQDKAAAAAQAPATVTQTPPVPAPEPQSPAAPPAGTSYSPLITGGAAVPPPAGGGAPPIDPQAIKKQSYIDLLTDWLGKQFPSGTSWGPEGAGTPGAAVPGDQSRMMEAIDPTKTALDTDERYDSLPEATYG
jgi:hypothetical protein